MVTGYPRCLVFRCRLVPYPPGRAGDRTGSQPLSRRSITPTGKSMAF